MIDISYGYIYFSVVNRAVSSCVQYTHIFPR